MRLSRNNNELLTLELTEFELLILRACLRESFAALDRRDFPLRVGVRIEDAAKLATELNALLSSEGVEE